jgi:transposase
VILWTTARVAEIIAPPFGVRYHPDDVGRLFYALDWTPQKPERRALRAMEEAALCSQAEAIHTL